MHRLLKRQIKQFLGDEAIIPDNLTALFKAINKSYTYYEDNRKLLERSMDISSQELFEANAQLRSDAEKQSRLLTGLKKSLVTLLSVEGSESPKNLDKQNDVEELARLIELQSAHIKNVESELSLVQQLINQSTDSVQVADETGKFIFVNQEACKRLGYSKSELLNMKVEHIESLFKEKGSWQKHIEHLKSVDFLLIEGKNKDREGKYLPIEVNAKYIKINNKGYIVAFSRNITERKKAEKKLQHLIEKLKNANKELKDFAYVVSHDLKAPLRGIGSLTDWLISDYKDVLDEDGQFHLSLLKKRVCRMNNLIEGILQYSRVGLIENRIIAVNLHEQVKEIFESITLPPNFDCIIPKELPTIYNDEILMKQVFQNLISNAIKYNDKTNGRIEFFFKENDHFFTFCVKDNGPGIPEKYHLKIFQIFQTLQARDKIEGTGIGLSLVKKIIENSHGKIWVKSKKNEGTAFYFTLPKVLTLKNIE